MGGIMSNFKKSRQIEATGQVAEIFADIQQTLNINFIPNFFQTLAANAPNVLLGTWTVYKQVNWKGMLPPPIKELVFTAISAAKNCHYCETAHLAFCAALNVDSDTLRAVVTDIGQINPAKTRAIVEFGVECALNPISITDEKCESLRKLGMADGEILELIAMVSFSLYAINLADAMKLDIDDDFIQILGGRKVALPGSRERHLQ
jgi:uncharacterized peroxidase-related enzyme